MSRVRVQGALVSMLPALIAWMLLSIIVVSATAWTLPRVTSGMMHLDMALAALTIVLTGFIMPFLMPLRYRKRALRAVQFSTLVLGGFFVAQYIVLAALRLIIHFGVDLSRVNEAVYQTVVTAIVWVVALVLVVGVPRWIFGVRTTLKDVGLQRLPTWSELGLAPAAYIAYMIVGAIVFYVVAKLFPGVDLQQVQETGFTALNLRYEYIVAFITLVGIAPVAEEIFFRGYLYGRLKRYIPTWVAIIVVSALFGAAHGQWNVAINTFVLGIFLCILRDLTGSLWPAIVLHMIKNGVAFYFLFVNPSLFTILGS